MLDEHYPDGELIAQSISVEATGLFSLGLSVLMVLFAITKFGQTHGMIRYISAFSGNNQWNQALGYFRQSVFVSLGIGVFLSVLLMLGAGWLAEHVFSKPKIEPVLIAVACILIPNSMLYVYSYALQGLKKIRQAMISQGFSIYFIAVCILVFAGGLWGSVGAMLWLGVGSFCGILFAMRAWSKASYAKAETRVYMPWSSFFGVSCALMTAELMGLIVNWAPSIFLGIWGTTEEVGIFTSASRVAWLVSFVLISVNSVVAPRFSELYAKGDLDAVRRVAQKSGWMVLLAAIPFSIVMFVFPDKIMGLFGEEFVSGSVYLQIIALGQLVNSLTGSVGFLLTMTGHEKTQRNIVLWSAIATVVLCCICIPIWGGMGAAVVLALVLAVSNLVAVFYVKKYLGFYSIPFFNKA